MNTRRPGPPPGRARRAGAGLAVALGLGALGPALVSAACSGHAPAGGGGGGGGADGAYAPSASPSAPPPPSGLIGALVAPPLEPGAPPGALLPSPVGGPWRHCQDNFRPEAGALRDVTRLTMVCGHVNGMRAVGPVEEGEVAEGGEARTHAFALRGGECVRLFAVADAPVDDLSVALAGPTGVLAVSAPGARWAVTLADRPLCVAAEGEYAMQVRARKGAGRYAAQAWRLP
ncbi:MAG TPA: hypothetical protein VFS43_31770 [Polyangiaceae bacterium]|nr:hypothetical protein [Polyangiaceae bacterium]